VNLDFSSNPLFSWYVVLLIFSGLVMLVMGVLNTGGLTKGWRVLNALFGVGFFGYGIYLGFVFQGGSYIIFFKAFILPVLMIVNFFRSMSARQKVKTAQAAQAAMYAGQVPGGYPQQGGPAGYGVPGGYPQQAPGGYPQQPAPGGYPAPGAYSQPAPGGYPQQPAPGGYPQQNPAGYPQQGPGQNG
jgi:hypothetical protein